MRARLGWFACILPGASATAQARSHAIEDGRSPGRHKMAGGYRVTTRPPGRLLMQRCMQNAAYQFCASDERHDLMRASGLAKYS